MLPCAIQGPYTAAAARLLGPACYLHSLIVAGEQSSLTPHLHDHGMPVLSHHPRPFAG